MPLGNKEKDDHTCPVSCLPPTGGMFEYVSGANFLGEITEWAGFALAGHSVHSSAFAIFTAVVLASRAVAHHK